MAKVIRQVNNIEDIICDSCGLPSDPIFELEGHKHWDLICACCLDFEEQLGEITDDTEEEE